MRLVVLAFLAACGKDDAAAHDTPPVITVTKADAGPPSVSCNVVIDKLRATVASYDAAMAALVGMKAPVVLASCLSDGWPAPLKECIAHEAPAAIAAHACDAFIPEELAQTLVDRLAPGRGLRARDFLQP